MKKSIQNYMNILDGKFIKHYRMIMILSLLSYFLSNMMSGLIKGGRWDLYENIAMADRFLDGQGFYYSPIVSSSPYFPGVAFLAIVVGKCFYPFRDYILLVLASLIGTVLLYILIRIGESFFYKNIISTFVTFILVTIGFQSYRYYMNEFKADSLIYIYALLIILVIDRIEKKELKIDFKVIVSLFVISFLMDVTKQQALYIDVAIGCYLLFSKNLIIKEKAVVLISMILAGLLDIIVLFKIPGMSLLAINNLSDMPYWDTKTIVTYMGGCFLKNILYFVLLFLFLFLLLARKIKLDSLGIKLLTISLAVGLGQIAGGWKIGGNIGNFEAGMILFLPFTVLAFNWIVENHINRKSFIFVLVNCFLIIVSLVMIINAAFSMDNLAEKILNDIAVSDYLSETFGDETIMYYSDNYMQISRSTVKLGMDLYTVPENTAEYMHTRESYLNNKTYKYLYVNPSDFYVWDRDSQKYRGETVESLNALYDNYYLIDDPNMPDSLKGKLFVAK